MSAQGSRNENPGYAHNKMYSTLKRVCQLPNPFRVPLLLLIATPWFSLRFEPWADISQRLRRFSIKFQTETLPSFAPFVAETI